VWVFRESNQEISGETEDLSLLSGVDKNFLKHTNTNSVFSNEDLLDAIGCYSTSTSCAIPVQKIDISMFREV